MFLPRDMTRESGIKNDEKDASAFVRVAHDEDIHFYKSVNNKAYEISRRSEQSTASRVRGASTNLLTSPSQRVIDTKLDSGSRSSSSLSASSGGRTGSSDSSAYSQSALQLKDVCTTPLSESMESFATNFVNMVPKQKLAHILLVWLMHMRPDLNRQILAYHNGKRLLNSGNPCMPALTKKPLAHMQTAIKKQGGKETCGDRVKKAVYWFIDTVPEFWDWFKENKLSVHELSSQELLPVAITMYVCLLEKYSDEDACDIQREMTQRCTPQLTRDFNLVNYPR